MSVDRVAEQLGARETSSFVLDSSVSVLPSNQILAQQIANNLDGIVGIGLEVTGNDISYFPKENKQIIRALLNLLKIKPGKFETRVKTIKENDGTISFAQIRFIQERTTATISISEGHVLRIEKSEQANLLGKIGKKVNGFLDYPNDWRNRTQKALNDPTNQTNILNAVIVYTEAMKQGTMSLAN